MSAAAEPPAHGAPLERLARRLVRHGTVYAIGSALGLALAIGQIAVLTRLMSPGEFGRFALLVIFSGFVTLLGNLGVVQGTLVSAFRGGDEDDLDEGDEPEEQRPAADRTNRRLLGTGLVVVLLIGSLLTGCAALAAPVIADLLLGGRGGSGAVVAATAYGALGSVWRLVSAIPRFERRPKTYVALASGQRVIALAAAAALLEGGLGISGAIAGLLIGRAAASVLAFAISRRRFVLALNREDAVTVARRGAPFVVISLAFFAGRNVDLYILSLYASDADVGLYRVAGRLSAFVGMALNVTLLAWGPLTRGPLAAALKERGAIDVARSRLVTYFSLLAAASVVALVLTADALIRIAAGPYGGASETIPLLGVAAAAAGLLTVVFRMARLPGKVRLFRRIGILYAALALVGSLVLVPPFGVDGAAVAAIVSGAVGAAIMIVLSQRGPHPLPLERGRLVRCALVTALCCGAGVGARALPSGPETAADVLIALAFAALVLATGVLPRAEGRRLLALAGLRRSRLERRDLHARLAALDPDDAELLRALAIRREAPADVGGRLGLGSDETLTRFVAVLRRLGDVGEPGRLDARIGAHLVSRAATTRRDIDGYMLALRADADALELDRLSELFDAIRRAPPSGWPQPRQAAPSSS